MVRLGDVCDILDNMRVPITASEREKGQYPYYGANGVQDYVANYIFDDELVLLAEDGGNFGSKERPIAYKVSGKCWVNNHAHVLKPCEELNVDYLCYSIMFYDVSKLISGTTRAKLNQSAVRKMVIPLPPLDVQRKIAQTLEAASELITFRKKQLVELDNLIKSTFYDMFGDPVINEKGWNVKTVDGVCRKILGGGTPSKQEPEYYIGNIPWVTPKDMKSILINDSIDHINEKAIANSSAKLIPARSILMVIRSGILKRVLPVAINSVAVAVNQDMKAFITNENVSTEYLLYFFIMIQKDILKNVRAVTADNIEFSLIKNTIVPIPPLSLQKQFAQIVTKIEEQKSLVQKALDESQYLFDSLMSEYFE